MSETKLSIGGKEYRVADLPAQAQGLCAQIQYCDERMAQIRMELDVLQAARRAAIQTLPPLLPAAASAA